ncbi:protein SGT1 homolog [Macrosteles quadrilineatus]|uniref:protein SGT1 homolog n=1 Tax=Macrosteles quadrilineatus TaxID=74068 RepID=UPI0023E0C72A|nr:protein SGT1 homolog [Macrosteles quadrilineatus]XP_054264860.1 protein SGT1 homolog [Macrosteles quadrilineatus]
MSASNSQSDVDSTNATETQAQKPKIKYDWYQTDTHVTVNVLVKNLSEDQVNVSLEEKTVTIHLPSEEKFILNLSKAIVPTKCVHRVKPTKIELKLKKLNEDTWADLEAVNKPESKEVVLTHTKRNWDRLVENELKDDAAEGEAALNELFQKIYTEGSDEVKKAMNKSFLESGGTVLSTNWNEVGEKKVEVKPPDGMEFKKWDEP